MNNRSLLTATLVLGLSAGLFAGADQAPDGNPQKPRREFRSDVKRPAPTPEQAAFFETRRALHDSLAVAMGAYSKAVREGAAPRSLANERERIADLTSRLERHRAENLETWLDVVAYRPDRPGKAKHMKHKRKFQRPSAQITDSTASP